ncbi:MAG TPA: ROK family transcriptional regulator [Vicinamibacteria bacterium]|nr:ROK family transcriptional regulator [Vicinamibacteria bacterium]
MSSPGSVEERARDAARLRELNLERVLAIAMDRRGPFTRGELMEETGLSAPTVGSLAGRLIKSGLIRDLGAGPSRGGRRPTFMEFNARHGFVAGVDLGPTLTRLAVADLRGELLGHRVVPTSNRGPSALLSNLANEVRAMLRLAHVPPERLLAVGAGAPGVVDPKSGRVVALAPNLKGWSEVPMGRMLKRALGAPVVVENDVNLAILGERWRGAARGHDTCAFITVGKGIGAGIVVNGELHHGHHFLAGEIALMCMGPQFVDADFGSQGCLEKLAGLKALAARWPHPAKRNNGKRWIGELFDAAHSGDRGARATVDEAVTLIGIATANLSVVIDPSIVVLGGALVVEGTRVVEDVRRIVERIVPTPPRIVPTELHEEAPLWGCLLAATNEARRRLRQRLGHLKAAG